MEKVIHLTQLVLIMDFLRVWGLFNFQNLPKLSEKDLKSQTILCGCEGKTTQALRFELATFECTYIIIALYVAPVQAPCRPDAPRHARAPSHDARCLISNGSQSLGRFQTCLVIDLSLLVFFLCIRQLHFCPFSLSWFTTSASVFPALVTRLC